MINTVTLESELHRIKQGPKLDECITGIGTVKFIVRCNGDAESVLEKAKTVMEVVSQQGLTGWGKVVGWNQILPDFFVSECSQEMKEEETALWLQHWNALSDTEREIEEAERRWSLSNWLYWLDPSVRVWQWWDALISNKNEIRIAVVVESWPFPWSSLAWLFRGSGAVSVTAA